MKTISEQIQKNIDVVSNIESGAYLRGMTDAWTIAKAHELEEEKRAVDYKKRCFEGRITRPLNAGKDKR